MVYGVVLHLGLCIAVGRMGRVTSSGYEVKLKTLQTWDGFDRTMLTSEITYAGIVDTD